VTKPEFVIKANHPKANAELTEFDREDSKNRVERQNLVVERQNLVVERQNQISGESKSGL
jgi:hypothetical protein